MQDPTSSQDGTPDVTSSVRRHFKRQPQQPAGVPVEQSSTQQPAEQQSVQAQPVAPQPAASGQMSYAELVGEAVADVQEQTVQDAALQPPIPQHYDDTVDAPLPIPAHYDDVVIPATTTHTATEPTVVEHYTEGQPVSGAHDADTQQLVSGAHDAATQQLVSGAHEAATQQPATQQGVVQNGFGEQQGEVGLDADSTGESDQAVGATVQPDDGFADEFQPVPQYVPSGGDQTPIERHQLEHGFGSDTFIPDRHMPGAKKAGSPQRTQLVIGAALLAGVFALMGLFAFTSSLFLQEGPPPTIPPRPVFTTIPIQTDKPIADSTEDDSSDGTVTYNDGTPQPQVTGSVIDVPDVAKPTPTPTQTSYRTAPPTQQDFPVETLVDQDGFKVTQQLAQVVTIQNAIDIKAKFGNTYARSDAAGSIYLPLGVSGDQVTLTDMDGNAKAITDFTTVYKEVMYVEIAGPVNIFTYYKDTTVWTDSETLRDGNARYFLIGRDSQEGNSLLISGVSIDLGRP